MLVHPLDPPLDAPRQKQFIPAHHDCPGRFGKFLLSTSASIEISLIGVPNLGRDFYVLACREWIGFANRPVLIPRHGHHHDCPQAERGSIGKLVGDVVHFSHGICGIWDAAQEFRMLYVGVIKNLEMIDAVVRLAGVAGWLPCVIVGPTYGDSSSQGAAVGKQDCYQWKSDSGYQQDSSPVHVRLNRGLLSLRGS